jgi:hypothetical protein
VAFATASIIAGTALGVIAVVSGCSKVSPTAPASSAPASSAPASSAATSSPRAPASPASGADAFTVTGDHPVQPNGSQDTSAATPDTRCNRGRLATDKTLGSRISAGFTLAGYSVSAQLLQHFLSGKGTEVSYQAGSAISAEARASSAFTTVTSQVQGAIMAQLRAGRMHVQLSAAQLPLVAFEAATSDLYWGFRGTQGLAVTGAGSRENGRFTGTLTYVIRDSYGFPADDTLGGFGAPMRYLQTVCGAPEHASGARWFPDTITVTVPFSEPA